MKKIHLSPGLVLLPALPILLTLCTAWPQDVPPVGFLSVNLSAASLTKTALPDSSGFLLHISDSKGNTVFDGNFGDCPQLLEVASGSYSVSVRSIRFSSPKFDAPLYGDDQDVVVPAGSKARVVLECSQINSGVRLKLGPDYLENCPGALLFLTSEDGRLNWAYKEDRTAYFMPGEVSLVLSEDGRSTTLLTKQLQARQMLTVSVSAPAAGSGLSSVGMEVRTDTSRTWVSEDVVIGGNGSAALYDVMSARELVGTKDVSVYGYIIGNASPFAGTSSATNLAISGRTRADSKDACLSVELKQGSLRDDLNLVDHPGNVGRKVFLTGDIITYYGMPGVKNIKSYRLE